jgi:tetratricopeptide (TPR) repeat protein
LLRRIVFADRAPEASERVLERAVHGRLHHDAVPDPALPQWTHRLPAVTQIRDLSQRWTAHMPEARLALLPETVAGALRTLAVNATTVEAVRAVYRTERSEAVAYGFVRDLLSKEESPELLMEAAWRASALSRLAQALDHYERAIELAPDLLPAYVEQLKLICSASASSDPELAGPFEIDLEFAARMEQRLARDFASIEQVDPLEAAEYEVQVADYYLRRTRALPARLNDVARFVHARMHGRDGELDPRKVELNVVYAELLLRERPADAASQLLRVDSLLGNRKLHPHVLPRKSLDRARARAACVRAVLGRQGGR